MVAGHVRHLVCTQGAEREGGGAKAGAQFSSCYSGQGSSLGIGAAHALLT